MNLAKDPLCKDRPLCFVGLPYEYFPSGVAQAMWLYGFSPSIPVYYDTSTFLWCKNTPSEYDPINIKIEKNIISLAVLDKGNSWLNPFNPFCIMGEIIKNKTRTSDGMVEELSYILDENYAKQNLLFITWDYKNWCFKIKGNDCPVFQKK